MQDACAGSPSGVAGEMSRGAPAAPEQPEALVGPTTAPASTCSRRASGSRPRRSGTRSPRRTRSAARRWRRRTWPVRRLFLQLNPSISRRPFATRSTRTPRRGSSPARAPRTTVLFAELVIQKFEEMEGLPRSHFVKMALVTLGDWVTLSVRLADSVQRCIGKAAEIRSLGHAGAARCARAVPPARPLIPMMFAVECEECGAELRPSGRGGRSRSVEAGPF